VKALKLELVGKEPCEELEGKVDGTDTCRIKHERFGGRRSAGRHTESGIYQNVEKVENTCISR
jgi:hypothetical protein